MQINPKNPCIYPKSDKRHIPEEMLENATFNQLVKYRLLTAQEWANLIREAEIELEKKKIDIEAQKMDKLMRVGKYSFFGTILASVIGSSVLLYINLEKKDTIPYRIEKIDKNLGIINENLDILQKKQNKLYFNQVETWAIFEKLQIAQSQEKIKNLKGVKK